MQPLELTALKNSRATAIMTLSQAAKKKLTSPPIGKIVIPAEDSPADRQDAVWTEIGHDCKLELPTALNNFACDLKDEVMTKGLTDPLISGQDKDRKVTHSKVPPRPFASFRELDADVLATCEEATGHNFFKNHLE